MERIDGYEVLEHVVDREPWRWVVAGPPMAGSPYRTAPERVLIRKLLEEPTELFTFMLLEHARIAPIYRHENIERALEWIDRGRACVTTLLSGWTVGQVLEASRERGLALPIAAACHIAHQVCRGLHYIAHEALMSDKRLAKAVHRRIAPGSVLLTTHGAVVLNNPALEQMEVLPRQRGVTPTRGELSRMTPEEAVGDVFGHRSDIYAVGALLYEMLTDRPCVDGEDPISIVRAVREGSIDPPSQRRREVGEALEAVVIRALARDPTDRQPTAGELAWNLELVMSTLAPRDGHRELLEHIDAIGIGERPRPRGL